MINLVVGSLDKKSQMLLVYVDLYFYILLYFRRANYKEVLPTVCSAETHHQVYFMKRAGSLSWVLCLKIWAAVEAEELFFLEYASKY